MHAAVALIALALGYRVFADAHKEKEGLKLLGQVIGLVVMMAAVLCMVCGAVKCMLGSQGYMMSKGGCPFAAKTACHMGIAPDSAK